MKLLVIIIFTSFVSFFIFKIFKKTKLLAIIFSIFFFTFIMLVTAKNIYQGSHSPDAWCGKNHATSSYPPEKLVTAMDYFEQGNYEYDTGNCTKAIDNYTKSIKLNLKYPQTYNNRGYTYMRLRNYKNALDDFDQAIKLNPDYKNALMNRGDIYNYYYNINRTRAVSDYEQVIKLGGNQNVCGHMFLAKHDGWNFGTILGFPTEAIRCM